MKEYYKKNRDKLLKQQKEYYNKNKVKIAEQGKEYRKKNKGIISKHKKEYYNKNKDKILKQSREHSKEYYLKNQEKIKKNHKEYRLNNKAYFDEYRKNNRYKAKEYAKTDRLNLKQQVINHYSNGKDKCVNCGLSDFKNLTIDHINGDGKQHRREIRKILYRWLIKHRFPEGYQVLCFGCNLAKSNKKGRQSIKTKNSPLKEKVIAYYSNNNNKCVFCGLDNMKNLTIDHINGGGTAHRKKITKNKGGLDFYRWLIKTNFPEGYQVLCFGCNLEKG